MNLKEARILSGLNKTDVANTFSIPYRSVQNWENGSRTCPSYVEKLLVKELLRLTKQCEIRKEDNYKESGASGYSCYIKNTKGNYEFNWFCKEEHIVNKIKELTEDGWTISYKL